MSSQNNDAERAVLGAMLTAESVIDDLVNILTGPDFYQPRHEAIWEAVLRVHRDGHRPDPILVSRALGPDLAKVGGAPYLVELTSLESLPTPAQATHYAAAVREAAVARRLIEAATKIRQMAESGSDIRSVAEDARREIDEATAEVGQANAGAGASSLVDRTIDLLEKGHDPGISTGWGDVDEVVNGLRPGQLAIVGARPSVGKSVVGANVAAAACKAGHGVHFASLEMTEAEVMKRLLSAEATIDLSRLMDNQLGEAEWTRLAPRSRQVADWPLWVDDTPAQSLLQLRARARTTARRMRLGLVVVDYLQLMSPRTRAIPREQQVGELSEGLKSLAKELHVPILALAQVNRGSADRGDHRPKMSDLRESGRIEADADHVWLLHREDLVDPNCTNGEIEVMVAKNRNGQSGRTITLAFQGQYSRVVQMAWSPTTAIENGRTA